MDFKLGERVSRLSDGVLGTIVDRDPGSILAYQVKWDGDDILWMYTIEIMHVNPPETVADAVNHPAHYNTGKIEVIDFIEDQGLEYHEANAIKYIARAGKKNPDTRIEDLEKGVWYLQRKIALLKGENDV